LLNSDGFTPKRSAEYNGGEKIGQFLTNKLMNLGNGAIYGHSCIEVEQETIAKLSNGATSDDLE